jgi:Fur family peroxide stress response transcriptional regulator
METKLERDKETGRKLKRTPQRLAILEYLEGNTTHPSADEIYRSVSKKYQSMSFATVYNTLNALTRKGVLRELTIDPERKRYDPDTSCHHHFICVICGKIFDVPEEIRVDLPKVIQENFIVEGHHIEFHGYCPTCRKKRKQL